MNNLKKRISILLAIVILIISLIIPVNAKETGSSDGAFISTGDKLYPVTMGDTYTYEYRLNLGKKLTALDASLSYDTEGLELVNYSFPVLGSSANAGTYGGKLYFNYSSATGTSFSSDSSVLIRATFKVKSASGTFDVHTDINDMARYQEVKIVENGAVLSSFTHRELITDDDSTTSIYIKTGNKYYKVKRGKTYNYICYLKTSELVGNLVANTYFDSYGLSTSSSTRTTYQSYSGKSFAADDTVLVSIPFTVSNYAYDNSTYYIYTSISKLQDINEDTISRYTITEEIEGLPYVTHDPNEPPTEAPPETTPPEPTEPPVPTEAPPEPTEYYCTHYWYGTYTENANYQYYSWGYTYNTYTYCSNCGQELYVSANEVRYADTSKRLNFDAASAGWQNANYIQFYIYDIEYGDELIPWGSKKLRGTKGANNIWSFDAESIGVVSGRQYAVIFFNEDTGVYTYDLLFDTSCFGDIAYATGNYIENPVDSNKSSPETRWRNSNLGPRLQVTSIGNLVGETVPSNTTKYQMMVNFLASRGKDGLLNALNYNGKDAQTAIDDIASKLGLTKEDVQKVINDAKTTGNPTTGDKYDWSNRWDASRSSLPGGSVTPTEPSTDSYGYVVNGYYLVGSINGDNSGTGNVHKNLRFEQGDSDYTLSYVKLTKEDKVNVAVYRGNNTFIIYPDGTGQEKSIDKSGYYTFYFKPYEIGNPNYWYFNSPSFVGEIVNGLLGDADGNEEIESVDATFIQRWLAKIDTPYTKAELMRGDVDGSGDLELTDVTAIQYYLCHLKTQFPIGKTIS